VTPLFERASRPDPTVGLAQRSGSLLLVSHGVIFAERASGARKAGSSPTFRLLACAPTVERELGNAALGKRIRDVPLVVMAALSALARGLMLSNLYLATCCRWFFS